MGLTGCADEDDGGDDLPGEVDSRNTVAATEDIEMTHAVKSLGYKPMAPYKMRIHTDTMPTWEKLKHQRIRWQRGMLDSLGSYGIRKMSWNYYRKLLWLYFSSLIPILGPTAQIDLRTLLGSDLRALVYVKANADAVPPATAPAATVVPAAEPSSRFIMLPFGKVTLDARPVRYGGPS